MNKPERRVGSSAGYYDADAMDEYLTGKVVLDREEVLSVLGWAKAAIETGGVDATIRGHEGIDRLIQQITEGGDE